MATKSRHITFVKVSLLMAGVISLILALVYVPAIVGRYALVGQQEKSTKAGLEQLRIALRLYRDDHGTYPIDPEKELVPQYVREIPTLAVSPQAHFWTSRGMMCLNEFSPTDTATWGYVNNKQSSDFGKVFVNCTHTDLLGKIWNTY